MTIACHKNKYIKYIHETLHTVDMINVDTKSIELRKVCSALALFEPVAAKPLGSKRVKILSNKI